MIINFTQSDLDVCSKFANSINTDHYQTRHQFNKVKRTKDQLVGKLAEFAVYRYFGQHDIQLSEPDLQIYDKSRKSWDFDLKGQGINVHVKSQSIEQAAKYGCSFIFENSDRHIFKDVGSDDYVCFVSVDLAKQTGEVKAVIKLQDLHSERLFKRPKLEYLTTKSAVYFDDLNTIFKDRLFAK